MRSQTQPIIIIVVIFLLPLMLISCKKREERDLIKSYEGTYSVICTTVSCCDSIGHPIYSQETMELDIRKSCKGVRIDGVAVFTNFDVNYRDRTFSAENKKTYEYASGRFLPDDSVYLWISFSPKLPNGKSYSMKKKI